MANSAYGEIVITATTEEDSYPPFRIVFQSSRSPIETLIRYDLGLGYNTITPPSDATYCILDNFSNVQNTFLMGDESDAGTLLFGYPILISVDGDFILFRSGFDHNVTVDLYFY